jgi:hypothetical protein
MINGLTSYKRYLTTAVNFYTIVGKAVRAMPTRVRNPSSPALQGVKTERIITMVEWPDWWDWELELDLPHLQKRMLDRSFSETDLRTLLEDATGYHEDHEPGRYAIETWHGGRSWLVIVEPQIEDKVLLVVTAYQVD